MIRIEEPELTVEFLYDGLNQRIGKIVNGVGSYFTVYDRDNPWLEFDSDGKVLGGYFYGDEVDQLLASLPVNEEPHWYLADQLGSVGSVTKTDGTSISLREYDSFGRKVLNYPGKYNSNSVYILLTREGAYVGKSIALRTRLLAHFRYRDILDIIPIALPGGVEAKIVEQVLINTLAKDLLLNAINPFSGGIVPGGFGNGKRC